jgi:HAD superfamily hydrolase (TIGR01509 family)
MIEAAIFDMDGVLIDSNDVAYHARAAVLRESGVDITDIPDPHNEAHKGTSASRLITAVKEHTGVSIDPAEYARKMYGGMADALRAAGVTADPELIALLHEFQAAHIPMGIATSGRRPGVDIKLGFLGIEPFFDVIVTADDVSEHKPNPASYITAMGRLGVQPANCLVFEDSKAGVQAGLAAGATVIGFSKYTADKTPIEGTAMTIDSWGQLDLDQLLGRT